MSKSFERHVSKNMSSNNTNKRIYFDRYSLLNKCVPQFYMSLTIIYWNIYDMAFTTSFVVD